jgi:hypothetical protein
MRNSHANNDELRANANKRKRVQYAAPRQMRFRSYEVKHTLVDLHGALRMKCATKT